MGSIDNSDVLTTTLRSVRDIFRTPTAAAVTHHLSVSARVAGGVTFCGFTAALVPGQAARH